jgi:hypothetical protein
MKIEPSAAMSARRTGNSPKVTSRHNADLGQPPRTVEHHIAELNESLESTLFMMSGKKKERPRASSEASMAEKKRWAAW